MKLPSNLRTICPECDFKITEDEKFCSFCKVQLWSNKTLKEWNKIEQVIEN